MIRPFIDTNIINNVFNKPIKNQIYGTGKIDFSQFLIDIVTELVNDSNNGVSTHIFNKQDISIKDSESNIPEAKIKDIENWKHNFINKDFKTTEKDIIPLYNSILINHDMKSQLDILKQQNNILINNKIYSQKNMKFNKNKINQDKILKNIKNHKILISDLKYKFLKIINKSCEITNNNIQGNKAQHIVKQKNKTNKIYKNIPPSYKKSSICLLQNLKDYNKIISEISCKSYKIANKNGKLSLIYKYQNKFKDTSNKKNYNTDNIENRDIYKTNILFIENNKEKEISDQKNPIVEIKTQTQNLTQIIEQDNNIQSKDTRLVNMKIMSNGDRDVFDKKDINETIANKLKTKAFLLHKQKKSEVAIQNPKHFVTKNNNDSKTNGDLHNNKHNTSAHEFSANSNDKHIHIYVDKSDNDPTIHATSNIDRINVKTEKTDITQKRDIYNHRATAQIFKIKSTKKELENIKAKTENLFTKSKKYFPLKSQPSYEIKTGLMLQNKPISEQEIALLINKDKNIIKGNHKEATKYIISESHIKIDYSHVSEANIADKLQNNIESFDKADLVRQLTENIHLYTSKDHKQEIIVNLKPEFLGKLRIRILFEANHVKIEFVTENHITKNVINSHLPILQQILNEQGLPVQEISILMNWQGYQENRKFFGYDTKRSFSSSKNVNPFIKAISSHKKIYNLEETGDMDYWA